MAVDINRVVNIKRYWAPVFSSLREAQQIASCEEPEFSLAWARVREYLDDAFVATAREEVISRWERIVGIQPLQSDTLDERRTRILYKMRISLPYTLLMLKHVYLAGIVGEGNYEVDVNHVACTLDVRINPAKSSQWDDVVSMLDTIVPANMGVSLGYMGTSHDIMAGYTHNELAEYTHDQIRDELMFIGNN